MCMLLLLNKHYVITTLTFLKYYINKLLNVISSHAYLCKTKNKQKTRCGRGRDRMVVGFKTTCAISAYHHQSREIEFRSWRGVLNTILSDINVCQWLAKGRWFSRYSWNIVESGVKHHNPNLINILLNVINWYAYVAQKKYE